MIRGLMDILACPVCKGKLELTVTEENQREVIAGSLHCGGCNVRYPIVETIPRLLPSDQSNQSGR